MTSEKRYGPNFTIRLAERCPSCCHADTIVPFVAPDSKQAFWRVPAQTETEARNRKTLFGGTTFALRLYVCSHCAYAMMYYDENVTWGHAADQ